MGLKNRLDIKFKDWTAAGSAENPMSRLLTSVVICGLNMHVEAIEIAVNAEGIQEPVDSTFEQSFSDLYNGSGASGHFEATELNGRKYCLFCCPVFG